MQTFKFAVTYKGGEFVKTVHADDYDEALAALRAYYAGSTDFEILRLITIPDYVTTNAYAGSSVTTWKRIREQCYDRADELDLLQSIELGPRVAGRMTAQNNPIQDDAYREVWAVMPFPAPSVDTIRRLLAAKRAAPTWDNLLGPVEDGDLMRERA